MRQSHPLSQLLFNLVMETALREVAPTWRQRNYGTIVGASVQGSRLTHVMFADDATLIANSWTSMQRMPRMLRDALARLGLNLHPSKCKAQTNDSAWNVRGLTQICDGFSLEVLECGEGLKILGTLLHMQDMTQHEMLNRISIAWRMFWGLKRFQQNQRVSIKRRLKLFSSTVGSCILWCAESWTPRVDDTRRLETAWNSMLRRMLGPCRAPGEEYLDWLRRATRKANGLAKAAGITDWVAGYRYRKWAWAGHVARRGPCTWVSRATTLRESQWQILATDMVACRPFRPSRRRWLPWEDSLKIICRTNGLDDWPWLALDRLFWRQCRQTYGVST